MGDKDKLKVHIENKVYDWLEYNGIEEDITSEIEVIEKALKGLELTEADLGGLKALRGFYYQYLVAIYYMVEMKYERRWDLITFELLDDIALISTADEKIRYVQVKTKREDNEIRTIKISDLTKRNKALNSWMDKLLMGHKKAQDAYKTFESQYELAVNDKSESDLSDFVRNDSYKIDSIDGKDSLFVKICKTVANKAGDELKWENQSELKKLMKRFRIRNFGSTDILRLEIERKIASNIITRDDEIYYGKAISEYVIKELIHKITVRSCDDSRKVCRSDLVFRFNEVSEWIDFGIEKGRQAIDTINRRDSIRKYFSSIFDELIEEFKSEWNPSSSDQLITAVNNIEVNFKNADINDPYFYYKFLSRLFEFENHRHVKFSNRSREKNKIKTAIEYLAVLHVIQNDNKLILEETNFVFKTGKNSNHDEHNFSICDMKGKHTFIESQQLIHLKADKCKTSKKLKHNYTCILNDVVSEDDELDEFFNESNNIPRVNEAMDNPPSALDVYNNIKFITGEEKMKKFIDKVKLSSMAINEIKCIEIFEKFIS